MDLAVHIKNSGKLCIRYFRAGAYRFSSFVWPSFGRALPEPFLVQDCRTGGTPCEDGPCLHTLSTSGRELASNLASRPAIWSDNPAISKSHDFEYQLCWLGHNFVVIFINICPNLEVVRIFKCKYCILITEHLAKF